MGLRVAKRYKPIGAKRVYRKKMNVEGRVEKYKARLAAKGYKQKARVDYDEIFALVGRMETIRLLLSFVARLE